MKKLMGMAGVLCLMLLAFSAQAAEERASKAEAEAMVKKAVAFLAANGPEKTFAEVSNKQGQFIDRDLYLSVYDPTGVCVGQGGNAKLIGKNMLEMADADGVLFIKDRFEQTKTKTAFWQDYKFLDPLTKKIVPKTTYCEKSGDYIFCGGVYK